MENTTIRLTGTVRKVIDCSLTRQPQQVQIALVGAGHLYDELRVPNTLGWKEGRAVEVTIRLLAGN
jgi:hypothetical protein